MSQQLTFPATGPDLIATRSAQAITKILRDLGTQGKLLAAFQAEGSSANITSCSATATLIMDRISPNGFGIGRTSVVVPPNRLKFWESAQSIAQSMLMTAEEVIAEIMRLLDRPIAICISVRKDHHFVVLPIDDDRIAMLQGFQGAYNLADWLSWSGVGSLTKVEFRRNMLDLVSDSANRRAAAALRLFAFQQDDRPSGGTSLTLAGVQQEIRAWFNSKTDIVAYAYKEL